MKQAKALNNIRSATKSISEGIQVPIGVDLDMAVEYIQVRHYTTHYSIILIFVILDRFLLFYYCLLIDYSRHYCCIDRSIDAAPT